MQTQSDSELVNGVLERDDRAFGLLFDRYAEALHRHASYIVRDEAAAQDVVQEVFLRVWNRADQWDGSGAFRAWLYRIATNVALNHLRTVKRRHEVPLELPAEPEDDDDVATLIPAWAVDHSALGPEATVELAEKRVTCRRLVARLPEDKREVIRLVHELDLPLRDAAEALGIPEGTVKSRLHYARERLSREWLALDAGSREPEAGS